MLEKNTANAMDRDSDESESTDRVGKRMLLLKIVVWLAASCDIEVGELSVLRD